MTATPQQLAEKVLKLLGRAEADDRLLSGREFHKRKWTTARRNLDALVVLAGRAHTAEQEREEAETLIDDLAERLRVAEQEHGFLVAQKADQRARAAEALAARYQQDMDAAVEVAESWHGPEPDMGHVRALAVIARNLRAALAGAVREEPK